MNDMTKEARVDFGRLVSDIAENNVKMVAVGINAIEERYRPAIRALEREFFASLVDPQTKMKTSLQVAIANVLALQPSQITERVTEYAEEKRRDAA